MCFPIYSVQIQPNASVTTSLDKINQAFENFSLLNFSQLTCEVSFVLRLTSLIHDIILLEIFMCDIIDRYIVLPSFH